MDDEVDEDSFSGYMDAKKWEEKRDEFTVDMIDLQEQYDILREKLYQERIVQIENKLAEVLDGHDPEYLQRLDELQLNMKNRMLTNAVLTKLKLTSINRKFEAEQLATQQNYHSEKITLYEKMWEKLEKQIRVLEVEDKTNVDFNSTAGISKPTNSGTFHLMIFVYISSAVCLHFMI